MSFTKEQRIINQMAGYTKQEKTQAIYEPKAPISDGLFLPNHSGIKNHPEFKSAIGDYVLKAGDSMTGTLNVTTTSTNVVPVNIINNGDTNSVALSLKSDRDGGRVDINFIDEDNLNIARIGAHRDDGFSAGSHFHIKTRDTDGTMTTRFAVELELDNTTPMIYYKGRLQANQPLDDNSYLINHFGDTATAMVLNNSGSGSKGILINQDASGIALEIDSESTSNEGIKVAMQSDAYTAIKTTGGLDVDGTVILRSDNTTLTFDDDATAGNPLLAQTLESSRTSYWKISGTDTAPATMSEGILSVVPTFTTGTSATGANLLFFKPTDSRSISSGTNFTRGIRIEPNRSGTKTSTGSDDLFGISIVPSDLLTANASSGTIRRYGIQSSSGSTVTLSQGGQTFESRNLVADGSIALVNSSGTNTSNIYGLEIADSYAEALIGGAITATKIGVYYHPTMTSAADVEYALLASRSGIGLLSDGATGTYTGGNLYLGAGKDAEIYYDGTDLCIGSALVGSGTINLTDHSASSITTETLQEYITIKVGGTSKKIAIVA